MSPSPVRDVSSNNQLSDKAIEKQSELSAKAKAVFEESLRQYEKTSVKDPPPLPPKTDRPPLPPKQRGSRSRGHDQDSSQSSDDQTYVNSAEVVRQNNNRNRTRLSVGSSPITVSSHRHTRAAVNNKESEKETSEFVYGNYYSGGSGGTKVSVPVRSSGQESQEQVKVAPPSLPPKELRPVSELSDNKVKAQRKGVSTTRIVGTNSKPPMKSVETQTDENEFYFMYDDGYKLEEESYNNHTDSEYSPESNRSVSPVTPAPGHYYDQHESKTPEHYYLGGNYQAVPGQTMFERPVSASPAQLSRHAGRRKLEPVSSVPVRPGHDPVISGEINWSVSQLRSLFNQQGLTNTVNTGDNRKQLSVAEQSYLNSGHNDNMVYHHHQHHRDSPARKQFHDHRRINYPDTLSGLTGNYVQMYSPDNNHTDSDQESYV